jgi:hypothetical protein
MHAKRGEPNAKDHSPDDGIDTEDLDDDDGVDLSDDDDGSDTDNVGDLSVELNVEELMAQLESAKSDDIARKKEIRRRLEEIQERRSLDDTYSFDLYDDDPA